MLPVMFGLGLARLLGLGGKPIQKTRGVSQSASAEERRLIEKYKPFTLTSAVRQYGLLNAINYIDRIGLPGDIVECGVWRGGNCMMAKEHRHGRSIKRDIYLFDTFCGMTAPSDIDVHQLTGALAIDLLQGEHQERVLAACSLEQVKKNFGDCGLDLGGAIFVQGPVEQTLLIGSN